MKVKKLSSFGLLFVILIVVYLFLIWSNFRSSLLNTSSSFGYLDFQNNWRALEDFINFKVPFKDYFFEYGSFFLFLQAPAYLFFGRSFLAVLVSRHLYLPLVSFILSYVIGVNVLRKRLQVLIFLFFLLLFGTNYDYVSVRHLMAELSLSFFILFLWKKENKYLLISGIIAGLAVLTALEYGTALNIAFFFIFLLSLFSKTELKKYFFSRFLLGQALVLLPYFLLLYFKGALINFFEFTFGYIGVFYSASPCSSDSFPRWKEIQALSQTSKLLVFNTPIEFLQKINLYLVFGFFMLVVLTLVTILIRKRIVAADHLIWFSLAIYGLLIFVRTLDTPCVGYFTYGLVPFFLLVSLSIEKILTFISKSKLDSVKIIGFLVVGVIFVWFILTENTGSLVNFFAGKDKKAEEKKILTQEFYAPVGYLIDKDLAKGYKEVSDYIIKNTNKDDYLYVYPWGPYNNLTGRRPPNSITNKTQFLAGEQFIERTKKELESKNPKFVVVNLCNNGGTAHFGRERADIPRYFSLGYTDGPVFAGEGNEVERYILENYEGVLNNEVALVMKKRVKPVIIARKKEIFSWTAENEKNVVLQGMKKTDELGKYVIIERKARWELILEKPIKAKDVDIEFKLGGNLFTKHLTRYFLNFYVLTSDSKRAFANRELASKEWQIAKIFPNEQEGIKIIVIEIGENSGLIWWLNPDRLEVRRVEVYGR